MSRPQNNLDDLKRRAQTGPVTGQQFLPQSQGVIQPKHFKFKSSTGQACNPAANTPALLKTSPTLSSHSSKSLPGVEKPVSDTICKPIPNSDSRPKVEYASLSASISGIVTACPTTQPSFSTVPMKRSSSDNFTASSEANKRTKVQEMPGGKEWSKVEDTWRDTEVEAKSKSSTPALPLPALAIKSSTSPAPVDTPVSSSLLADYSKHTTENLKMMMTNNMSARIDTLDKILRIANGQEPGLDRDMLQESSDNLALRISAIRTVLHDRESGAMSLQASRVGTPTPDTTVNERSGLASVSLELPLSSATRMFAGHASTDPNENANHFLQGPLNSSTITQKSSVVHKTDGPIPTSSSEKRVYSVSTTPGESEDDEDAMWALLDDMPTEVLDLSASPPNTPLQSIGNTFNGRHTPSRKQISKVAQFSPDNTTFDNQMNTPYYSEIMCTLRSVFNLDSFRPNQLEAITATMSGKDVFVLMPTGGGKSLCYQVPAVCQSGVTKGVSVVVSPLIALMIDQVHHLEQRGIDVVLFNSDQGHERSREARARLTSREKKPKLLYVTPEKLHKSNDMRSILAKLYREGDLARFVIDEAHCVSTWGRDFRDAYQDLDRLRQEYPTTPIMALTATANEQVMNDVINRLGIQKCTLLTQSFNRPNLHYEVRQKKRNVIADINDLIQKHHRGQTGIVYCLSRNKCEEVAKELREKYGLKARHYHAQMSVEDKSRSQTAWQNGQCDIIVATIAFGMGIDKADVRFVIHHSLPMSLDGYYQETGRAGRDGKPAACVLFYSYADTKILFKLIQDGEKPVEEKKRQEDGVRCVVQYCQNEVDCRRVQVLGYFGQAFDPKDCQKRCNNCLDNTGSVEQDMSEAATQAIRLVKDLVTRDRNVTKLHCLDVFRGANLKAIRDKGHDHIQLFGAGSTLSREAGERLFDHLLSLEAFHQVSVTNKSGWNTMYMQLGPTANDFLTGKRRLKMMVKVGKSFGESSKSAKNVSTKKTIRRKSGGVASVNRSQNDDIFGDAEDIHIDELSKGAVDMDDIYDFGSSPPRPAASTQIARTPKVPKRKGPPNTRQEALHITEDSDASQRCYEELLVVRDKVARDFDVSPEQLVDETLLQIISAILPTDHASFKEVLNENLSKKQADELWNRCGRRVLEVCANHKMSSTKEQRPATKRFDAVELHAQYDFSSSSSAGGRPAASKTKATVSMSKAPCKGSIRPMPL